MIDKDKLDLLNKFTASFSKEEKIWISGYLYGTASDIKVNIAKFDSIITIIYITETGNAKKIANDLAAKFKNAKIKNKIFSASQYKLTDLANEKYLLLITSTHGDGEIPEQGKKFWEFISSQKLDLSGVKYAILALGDSSYPLFCQSGKDIDAKLTELGGKRIVERADLDIDFEEGAKLWIDNVANAIVSNGSVDAGNIASKPVSKKRNHIGKIIKNIVLNDHGSEKETRHIEVEFEDEVEYKPGDAMAIILNPDDKRLHLMEKVDGKIPPRLYSIASSKDFVGTQIDLCVSVVKYKDENGITKKGICSNYLASLEIGEELEFYIQRNGIFKLPSENKDIIMIGAGTGIAPFRAFLQERDINGAEGKNWLFFGEQHARTDFLYQSEWQSYLESGLLTKMSVAFSRDQAEKIYVQNKMLENGEEFYQWLQNGAYIYVCGDKANMARDVNLALIEIVVKYGKISYEKAEEFVTNLTEEGRYLKDVY